MLEERAPHAQNLTREEILAELARRYFTSRGPATIYDFSKWCGLTVADARAGLVSVRSHLQHAAIDGQDYWFTASVQAANGSAPTAYLLSIYDEYVSAYKDYSEIRSNDVAAILGAMGNDLTYIIVVGGQIVGTWKRTLSRDTVTIHTNLIRQLTDAEQEAVAAQRYSAFHELAVQLE